MCCFLWQKELSGVVTRVHLEMHMHRMDHTTGPNLIKRVENLCQLQSEGDVTKEEAALCLERWRKKAAHQRTWVTSGAGKGKKIDCPLEPPAGM